MPVDNSVCALRHHKEEQGFNLKLRLPLQKYSGSVNHGPSVTSRFRQVRHLVLGKSIITVRLWINVVDQYGYALHWEVLIKSFDAHCLEQSVHDFTDFVCKT